MNTTHNYINTHHQQTTAQKLLRLQVTVINHKNNKKPRALMMKDAKQKLQHNQYIQKFNY